MVTGTRRKKLDEILKSYVYAFEKKHELELEHVVVDDLMGVLCFGDVLYFSMSDIIYDIDNKLKKGLIIDWLYDNLENQKQHINLHSYANGLRHKDL